MRILIRYGKKEEGSIMVVALLILVLLTIIGLAATNTSKIELNISGNEKLHKMAFYAAEASRAYVAKCTNLYGSDNVTVGAWLDFPDRDNPSVKYTLGPSQSFNGRVEYLGSTVSPRGSGTQVGTFKAHRYRMTCYGYGPSNAESRIEAGFYRLGF